ncbi:ELMO/CED-12 family protein [Euphorbia peplus]|nr:ELMO/CED-12 family protein [Euphorbia peplus]
MSKTLRRRLHHGDVDSKEQDYFDAPEYDGLDEPLLQNHAHYDMPAAKVTLEEVWEAEQREHLHWTFLLTQIIAQWAQWIASSILGTRSLLGRLLPVPFSDLTAPNKRLLPPCLSPLQEERLRYLRHRMGIPFDGSRVEHQDALRQLWRLAYPDRELPPLKSEVWKDMGWQGADPSTDFRGGGYISLENLIFFAEKYPASFQRLLHKKDGTRAEWEYPFAVAGVNISFMLTQMLDLQAGKPSTAAGIKFLELLAEDDMAFDNLYCVAFQMMDAQWLAKRASYMQFNEVLNSTRNQLERELALDDVCRVKDMPAYSMLIG